MTPSKYDFKLINEFSQWLTMYDWRKNHFNALWYQADSMFKEHKFSTIYKKFLKSKSMN